MSAVGSQLVDNRVVDFLLASTPEPEFDPNTVTPGAVGFIVIFLVAVVTVLLVLDMVRRIRRTTYRAQIQEKLQAEAAAKKANENNHPE